MSPSVRRIVLAYSGGLDTSVILRWLVERYQAEVVAFCADLGQAEELDGLDAKARATGAVEVRRRRPARGVRARLRLPDAPRRRDLRGPVPARHVDRAAADRQAPGRDRARGGRRRRRPRRHRQGQRPGALRAHVRRAGAGADRHRALARVGLQGPRRPDRLRRARSAFPITVDRREALLERPQPAARQLRGRHPRGPLARARTTTCSSSRWRPRRRPTGPRRSRSSSRRACRSRSNGERLSPAALLAAPERARRDATASAASTSSRTATSA